MQHHHSNPIMNFAFSLLISITTLKIWDKIYDTGQHIAAYGWSLVPPIITCIIFTLVSTRVRFTYERHLKKKYKDKAPKVPDFDEDDIITGS